MPPASIDAYLATVPADQRAALEALRQRIHAIAPDAEECIAYGVPAFCWHGKPLVGLPRRRTIARCFR
jgi:uncharacterized protein YdhG (YjbR/CyaY superfamily)